MARAPTDYMSSRTNTTSTCAYRASDLPGCKTRAIAKGEKRQLDIQLRPGPTFRAIVLDIETNEPVAGIRLWNWRQEGIEGVSDDAGMVTIENMTPGPFEFDVTAVGERAAAILPANTLVGGVRTQPRSTNGRSNTTIAAFNATSIT